MFTFLRKIVRYRTDACEWMPGKPRALFVYFGAGAGYVTWLYGSHRARYQRRFPTLHGAYIPGWTFYIGRGMSGHRDAYGCLDYRPRRFSIGLTRNANRVPYVGH